MMTPLIVENVTFIFSLDCVNHFPGLILNPDRHIG